MSQDDATVAADPWGLAPLAAPPTHRGRARVVRPGDVPQLSAWAAGGSALAVRARGVLLSGRGHSPSEVAAALGTTRQTVHLWLHRYEVDGLGGLHDRDRPLTRALDDAAIVAATLRPPPRASGLSHWSARTLGAHLGIGHSTVGRAWQEHGVRPHGLSTFRLDTDPPLVAHVADVVGLVVARDLRLVAVSLVPAGSTRGTRHHAPAGQQQRGDARDAETGHGPLRAFAALRAAEERAPTRPRPGAGPARAPLEARLPSRRPDRVHELTLIGDRPDIATLEALQPWRRAHPRADVRHVAGPEQWLRLVAVLLHLAEAGPTSRGVEGCAAELAQMVRGLVDGTRPAPGRFAWVDPAWRRTPRDVRR
ncbi:helix-turn-helix domain-containing protein [Nocardioides sp. C4-1]|uniref:helix-turn-helix domain-containing protein n=1 Tax=Nocardioides sp. C4-1 TaxID=3151851 RepID=UPI003262DBB9